MTQSFIHEQQHEFNAVGRYKYVSQDDIADEAVRRTRDQAQRAWPPGFTVAFILCVSVLLWIWIIGAGIWIEHHFS
jgi:hypothetical protein